MKTMAHQLISSCILLAMYRVSRRRGGGGCVLFHCSNSSSSTPSFVYCDSWRASITWGAGGACARNDPHVWNSVQVSVLYVGRHAPSSGGLGKQLRWTWCVIRKSIIYAAGGC